MQLQLRLSPRKKQWTILPIWDMMYGLFLLNVRKRCALCLTERRVNSVTLRCGLPKLPLRERGNTVGRKLTGFQD